MLTIHELGWFALAALVLTPGPNMAGGITAVLSRSRGWLQAQRWVMAGVLGALAVHIAFMEKQ